MIDIGERDAVYGSIIPNNPSDVYTGWYRIIATVK
jgi:hypothetical protein